MIELYGMGSPNVAKVAIMLEEAGRPYEKHHVSVMRGENRSPEFLTLNPLAKVPVIVDTDAAVVKQVIFESGAILIYLAESYAPALLPPSGPARWEALQWLAAQISLVGPMLGQWNHFLITPDETGSYAGQRYRDQAHHVYRTLENRLSDQPWLGGEAYSVADIATFPWANYVERHGFSWSDFPSLESWYRRIENRPAVRRAQTAMAQWRPQDLAMIQGAHAEDLDRFFGRTKPGTTTDFSAMAR